MATIVMHVPDEMAEMLQKISNHFSSMAIMIFGEIVGKYLPNGTIDSIGLYYG